MKLSERDKKLLLILVLVIVVCVPYFFVIQPLIDECDKLNTEITQIKSDISYRETLALQENEFSAAAGEYATAKITLIDRFPSELLQEASILFIHNTEQTIPMSLYQVAFGDDVATQITSEAVEAAIDEVEAATGDVTNDSVIEDNTTATSLGGGLIGMQTQTRFAYDVPYQEFKSFLKYIMDYRERMVITELDASYSAEMDMVNGNFTLAQYALSGNGRYTVQYLEPNMIQGTTNVFKQASGSFEKMEVVQETPDFFVLLNNPGADVDSIIVGKSNDASETTYLSSQKNAVREVTITFTGEGGAYNANYVIASTKYSNDGIDFEKDGMIFLQIISSSRMDDDDKVGIDLNVVNETDTQVKLEVINDDSENPRVEIKGITGDVLIK